MDGNKVPSYQLDQEILDARGITMSVEQVVSLTTSQYTDLVRRLNLTQDDLLFVKGLRRRIKNRLASQNSRRRSVEHLRRLSRELRVVRACKGDALSERDTLANERQTLVEKCTMLHTHITKVLEDRKDGTRPPALALEKILNIEQLMRESPSQADDNISRASSTDSSSNPNLFECRIDKLVQKSVNHIFRSTEKRPMANFLKKQDHNGVPSQVLGSNIIQVPYTYAPSPESSSSQYPASPESVMERCSIYSSSYSNTSNISVTALSSPKIGLSSCMYLQKTPTTQGISHLIKDSLTCQNTSESNFQNIAPKSTNTIVKRSSVSRKCHNSATKCPKLAAPQKLAETLAPLHSTSSAEYTRNTETETSIYKSITPEYAATHANFHIAIPEIRSKRSKSSASGRSDIKSPELAIRSSGANHYSPQIANAVTQVNRKENLRSPESYYLARPASILQQSTVPAPEKVLFPFRTSGHGNGLNEYHVAPEKDPRMNQSGPENGIGAYRTSPESARIAHIMSPKAEDDSYEVYEGTKRVYRTSPENAFTPIGAGQQNAMVFRAPPDKAPIVYQPPQSTSQVFYFNAPNTNLPKDLSVRAYGGAGGGAGVGVRTGCIRHTSEVLAPQQQALDLSLKYGRHSPDLTQRCDRERSRKQPAPRRIAHGYQDEVLDLKIKKRDA